MRVNDIEVLFDYSYWANEKLFQVVSQLGPEPFTRTIAGSYGSVRNTLVHVLSAEWGWLERCGGEARGPALDPNDFPTIASVIDTWRRVERSVREYLSTLRDEDLERPMEFAIAGGPEQTMRLGEMLHHAATHGVHHRGQLALLLRALGYTPGNFDLLLYFLQKNAGAAPG